MKIRVVEDIDDRFLKLEWERLEHEADVFPQSTYHWCATWWRYLHGRRQLHVVMVLDDNGRAVGIAPLCIERQCGVRVLRSFPVNFGDFYSFLIPQEDQPRVMESIYGHVAQRKDWQAAYIGPVNDSSPLHGFFCAKRAIRKPFSRNIVADIGAASWEEYLARLSRHRRQLIRRMLRVLQTDHKIRMDVVTESKGCASWFSRVRYVQARRSAVDGRPKKSVEYMMCAEQAYAGLFDAGRLVLHALSAGDRLIAYQIGFIHNNIYYDWNTNFDVSWAKYSPGLVCTSFVIKDLIEKGFQRVDFMAGVYDWKLRWAPHHEVRENDVFLFGNHSLRARLFVWYHLYWRERLKAVHHKIKAMAKQLANSNTEISE